MLWRSTVSLCMSFDYNLIEGQKIVVDRAKDGDEFETLDGVVRKLDSNILMINDAKKAVAIAGIMVVRTQRLQMM